MVPANAAIADGGCFETIRLYDCQPRRLSDLSTQLATSAYCVYHIELRRRPDCLKMYMGLSSNASIERTMQVFQIEQRPSLPHAPYLDIGAKVDEHVH